MSVSVDQLITDSKKIANRLKSRVAMADSLMAETEAINDQLESMRQVFCLKKIGKKLTKYKFSVVNSFRKILMR